MAKCPYCNEEVHLSDFFSEMRKSFSGRIKGTFKGEKINRVKMFVCPHCEKILGFTDFNSDPGWAKP